MEFHVLTLRYCAALGVIDDAPFLALARDHEVLGLREHFFTVHDVPHLLCVVSCRPRSFTEPPHQATVPASPSIAVPAVVPPAVPSPVSATSDSPVPLADLPPEERRLYEHIRRWRFETAHRDGVPPYVILTNRNLADLVRERPTSLAALRRVRGIGQAKAERHGAALLALLRGEALAGDATRPRAGDEPDPTPSTSHADTHEPAAEPDR